MNSFGTAFRVSVFGESHGPCVGVVLDGVPAGIALSPADFAADINRRRPEGGACGSAAGSAAGPEAGSAAGGEGCAAGGPAAGSAAGSAAGGLGTTRREDDIPELASGVCNGFTTGAPIVITFKNQDCQSSDYEPFKDMPRPGHADFVAQVKYGGFADLRGGGHFSGRLTLPLVAAGVVAKKILGPAYEFSSYAEISEELLEDGDSVGGTVYCVCTGAPVGLGEPFFDSVESLVAHLAFSIPGVRGVEFGDGFAAAEMRGSEHNDPLVDAAGHTARNASGGVNGGITNGNAICFAMAVKPTSSIAAAQQTFNFATGRVETLEIKGRHDRCIAKRCPVIAEAALAIALADLSLRG